MKIFINLLFLSLFFIGWDIPDSYASPNRTSFSSVSNNNNLKYIPINSVAIQTLNIGQIMNKMNYAKIINTDLMDYAFDEMRNNDVPRKIRGFIKDPYLMGINLDQPIYGYIAPINKEKTYHEKPTQLLVNLYRELKKENLFNQKQESLTKEECYSINNNLNSYVYISPSLKEDWSFSIYCNSSYEWNYEDRRYTDNYYISRLVAESTSSMEHGYGNTIELWSHSKENYDIYGYGHNRHNRLNEDFTFGFVVPMKDLDLFEANVASIIDLIPDRDINIKDGEINGFKYKLIQERDEIWDEDYEVKLGEKNTDRFIVAYNKDVILISFNVTDGMGAPINLISNIENKITNQFDTNKPGLDEIHAFDTSLWINTSITTPSLKNAYSEFVVDIMRGAPNFDRDSFIKEQEKQWDINREMTPYFITGINVNKNDISISMKSFFSDTGKDYFKDISKVLDKKMGKEIMTSVPTNNMIAGMGYSVNLIEAINFAVNYENKLLNTNHVNDFFEEVSSELKMPANEIKEMFSGNVLALLYDIDFENRRGPIPEIVFVFGLENSDNFINTFNRVSELDNLLYKDKAFIINEGDDAYILIKDNFGYIGTRSVINGLIYSNSYQSKISKVVNNKPENLNVFFSVNLDEAVSLIPTDRDRDAREVKSFLRGLGLGSLNFESMFNENYSELSGKIEINSSGQNPLEFIIFNLIPVIEDELLD